MERREGKGVIFRMILVLGELFFRQAILVEQRQGRRGLISFRLLPPFFIIIMVIWFLRRVNVSEWYRLEEAGEGACTFDGYGYLLKWLIVSFFVSCR